MDGEGNVSITHTSNLGRHGKKYRLIFEYKLRNKA